MSLIDRLLPSRGMTAIAGFEPGLWAHRAPPMAQSDRYYLHVRPVVASGANHLFQFALVDASANVALSAFARAPSSVDEPELDDGDEYEDRDASIDAPITALDWIGLGAAMRAFRGMRVMVFGRTLPGCLFPPGVGSVVTRPDCARSRFLKVARRRGVKVDLGDRIDLNDARRLVGLPTVRSPDAAMRAMGLRELCLWMDGADLD